jgi:hypothetical protein
MPPLSCDVATPHSCCVRPRIRHYATRRTMLPRFSRSGALRKRLFCLNLRYFGPSPAPRSSQAVTRSPRSGQNRVRSLCFPTRTWVLSAVKFPERFFSLGGSGAALVAFADSPRKGVPWRSGAIVGCRGGCMVSRFFPGSRDREKEWCGGAGLPLVAFSGQAATCRCMKRAAPARRFSASWQ